MLASRDILDIVSVTEINFFDIKNLLLSLHSNSIDNRIGEKIYCNLGPNTLPWDMKCDELLKILQKDGWYEIRQKGSHKILRKQETEETIIFPYHRGKEIPTGTCNRILKQAGLK
jgi:predicted RNA binding protein YcfA (HicA-like mRNA interferase family)